MDIQKAAVISISFMFRRRVPASAHTCTQEYLHSKSSYFLTEVYSIQLSLVLLPLCAQEAAVVPLLRDLHSVGMSKGHPRN